MEKGCGIYQDGHIIGGGPRNFCLEQAEHDYSLGKGKHTIEVKDGADVVVWSKAATVPMPLVEGLDEPGGLSPAGKAARQIAVSLLTAADLTYTGGCRAFYTPLEWEEHEGKKVGGELVIVYDGGDVSELAEGYLQEQFQRYLQGGGMCFEAWTNYYGVVYVND